MQDKFKEKETANQTQPVSERPTAQEKDNAHLSEMKESLSIQIEEKEKQQRREELEEDVHSLGLKNVLNKYFRSNDFSDDQEFWYNRTFDYINSDKCKTKDDAMIAFTYFGELALLLSNLKQVGEPFAKLGKQLK